MHFHRFASRLTVMVLMAAFLLSAFAPVAFGTQITEEEQGTQAEIATDENGEKVTEEYATDENGAVLTTVSEPQYVIVENTTADPDATTEAPTEEPTTVAYETVTDENGEIATDENGNNVTVAVTEEQPTDENGEIITTEPPTEAVTEPPVPDALSENGLLLTIADRDADYGYRIVIPKDCSNETGYAAGLLQTTLQKMTGVLLPIVSDRVQPQDREICVGKTNRTKKDPGGVSENGFYLHTQGERLYLYALGEQGAIYAVTAFLREICGCSWFAAGQTVIPSVQTLSVPANLSLRRGVYFSYNETYSALTDASFLQMNSLSGGAYTFVSDDGTNARTYLSPCENTLGTVFVPAEQYFETNPEYFALYKNERNSSQLCLTNWDVYSLVLEKIENTLRSEGRPTHKKQIICLSLPLNDVICECDVCAALTAQNGSYAGVLLTFLNRISAGLFASGYNNLQIETSLGSSLFAVPSSVVPAHNITVRMRAENRCVSHSLTNANCGNNRYFLAVLKEWLKLVPTVYVDLPTENIAHTIGIFANWEHLQTDLQTLYYLGVDGISAADDECTAACGPEFRAFRMYLLTRLMADPYCDLKAEKEAFLKSWYGNGYQQIGEILDIFSKKAGDSNGHLYITSSPENSLTLSLQDIQRINTLWDEATALCSDGRQLLHLEQSRLAWRFWQACCKTGVFAGDDTMQATRQLMNDLQSAEINRYSVQNETLNLSLISSTLRPQEWNTPALTLLQPALRVVQKLIVTALVFALLVLGLVALVRRKWLLLFPLWLFIVTVAVFPWHTENIVNHAWGLVVLTGLIPLAFVCLLAGLAVYMKYNDVPDAAILRKLIVRKSRDANAPATQPDASVFMPVVQHKKRILLWTALASFVAVTVYYSLVFLPLHTNTTGAQCALPSACALGLHASVSAWFLSVRFLRK